MSLSAKDLPAISKMMHLQKLDPDTCIKPSVNQWGWTLSCDVYTVYNESVKGLVPVCEDPEQVIHEFFDLLSDPDLFDGIVTVGASDTVVMYRWAGPGFSQICNHCKTHIYSSAETELGKCTSCWEQTRDPATCNACGDHFYYIDPQTGETIPLSVHHQRGTQPRML